MALPALRSLDIYPVEQAGQTRFCLRDSEGITEKPVLLTREQVVLASCLDGLTEIADLQAVFVKAFGVEAPAIKEIERFVALLDEALLLETPRFRNHFEELQKRFLELPTRPPAFAGVSYPADPKELERQMDDFFTAEGGPGEQVLRLSPRSPPINGRGGLVGLVAPHIDFQRGGHAYAWAYKEILERGLADLYVIIGVAHISPPSPFILTLKDFETPFGPAVCDRALAQALYREVEGTDLLEHEFTHRSEQSAEFQAVWLAYCRKKLGGDFKILPLLAASPEDAGETLDALGELLAGYQGKVCLLSGADLAHVGPRFGDKKPVAELLGWMEEGDKNSLEKLLAKDPQGFFQSVMHDGGKRRVCGLTSLTAFTTLLNRLYPDCKAKLLKYDHAADPAGGEVSFASISYS